MDKIKFVKCESGLVFALDEVETIVPEGSRYRVHFKRNNDGEVYYISQADYDRLMELFSSRGFMEVEDVRVIQHRQDDGRW